MICIMGNRKDVRAIIAGGGGASRLHERSKVLLHRPIAEKTIYSWFSSGIPEKHWAFVMPECSVTEEEIHKANEELRKSVPNTRHKRRAEARAA